MQRCQVKLASEAKAQHAQDTLKGVLRKHHRQRETREFATRPKAAPAPPQAPEATAQLIQRSRSNHSKERAEEQSLDVSWVHPFSSLLQSCDALQCFESLGQCRFIGK